MGVLNVWVFGLLLLVKVSNVRSTDAPLIGVLALPCSAEPHNCLYKEEAVSYMSASYVKFLESGGSRVIPIKLGMTQTEIQSLIDQLNGVLFTGGAAAFNNESEPYYWNSVNWILSYLRETVQKTGQSVPLWATCLGFEAVLSATAQGGPDEMASGLDAEDWPINIDFTEDAKDSVIFGPDSAMDTGYSSFVYDAFASENISFNAHSHGFYPSSLSDDPWLSSNFTLLGSSPDRTGVEFATLVQSRSELGLRWFLSQFHPEKPTFIFDPPNDKYLPHSLSAVTANQYLGQFFVNQCRESNDHSMDSQLYWDSVIYNYSPYFVAKQEMNQSSFEQIYIFD